MGYMLPIQPLQSKQYHQRVMRTKHNPYDIERVYKIINVNAYNKSCDHKYPNIKRLYAEITRKGRHINKRI